VYICIYILKFDFFFKLYKQKGLAWEEASKYVAKQRAKALKAGGAQESKPVAVAPPPGTYVYVYYISYHIDNKSARDSYR